MKLSTKSRYAVMALAELASHGHNACVSLSVIAEKQELPLPYLEQLFARLRKANLVSSSRGASGGYELARDMGDIPIYDVILAVDSPIRVTRCQDESPKGCTKIGKRCLTHGLWHDLGFVMQNFLTQMALADIVHKVRTNPMVVLHRQPILEAKAI